MEVFLHNFIRPVLRDADKAEVLHPKDEKGGASMLFVSDATGKSGVERSDPISAAVNCPTTQLFSIDFDCSLIRPEDWHEWFRQAAASTVVRRRELYCVVSG